MKLVANLVPRSLWGFNARNVGNSDWQKIKVKARQNSQNICIICGRNMTDNLRDLHTHEFWEYNEEFGVAKIVRIGTVCVDCHDIIHLGRTYAIEKESRLNILNAHFCKVNGLQDSSDKLNIEHQRAMNEWRRRSNIDWKQDLSILAEFGVKIPELSTEQADAIKNIDWSNER